MPIVNLGAINQYNTPPSRNIVRTSDGKLVLFAIESSGFLKYKTSSDNGATWDENWTTAFYGVLYNKFSLEIDSSDNIHICYISNTNVSCCYRKLTYSGGTWSVGSEISWWNGVVHYHPNIIVLDNGNLYASYDPTGTYFWYRISTDGGASWSDVGALWQGTVSNLASIADGNNYRNIILTTSGGLNYDGVEVTTGLPISPGDFSVIRKDSSNIYIAVQSSSGIKVFYYNGASWDSGTSISDNSNDSRPTLQVWGTRIVCIWRDYDGTNYNIAYRILNAGIWESQINITDDVAADDYPNCIRDNSVYIYSQYYSPIDGLNFYYCKPHKIITSDVWFKAIIQETILSDIKFILSREQRTINSDVHFKGTIQQTILSDVKFVIEGLYNINNKVNFVKQVLSNINNKVNTVIRVFKDINNYVNTVKRVLNDVNNKVNTKKQPLYNINNDVRFIKSWQRPGDYGFQSLGKSYIKIYIDDVEQTDVDVDSIKIYEAINQSHTASFDLGRAYDGTLPSMEASVLIKYSDWVLYSGYIISISPASDPESITVNCQDEFWKENKTNKYFFVGHKPTDDKELYYDTIQEAISTEFSWNLSIGDFVPEVISCFAEGQADILSNLIQQCGNYGFYYDKTGTKKLWKAGAGDIINIQRQTIGSNIDLYQLISHKYNRDVSGLVNKLRVQMGDKVIRKFNSTGGSRTYTGYNYSSYSQFVNPAWDSSLELLSNQTLSGYGFDHRNPAYDYSDVFTKYHLPYLNPELSSWSDCHPPYVEVYNVSSAFGFIGSLNLELERVLTEGFTIDYENQSIKFSEPMFLYQIDANGECIAVRAPIIKVFLWKKNYYTFTEDPTDDPETDVSNPLMFFTNKVGSYADTIIKQLDLSQLSIQVGGLYQNLDGTTELIPSWDDTEFAEDLAYWQLSKTAYEKITIDIELTLDAVCFYDLTLNKRIYIDGITDEAMNIISIDYNIQSFAVSIQLESLQPYNRSVSLQSRGE